MKVYLKKVIILQIVFIIMIVSVFQQQFERVNTRDFNIGIVSPEITETDVATTTQNVSTTVANIIFDYNDQAVNNSVDSKTLSFRKYQLDKESELNSQLTRIAKNNELVIFVTEFYNEYLAKVVSENPDTYFIIIDNSTTYYSPNLIKLTTPINSLLEDVAGTVVKNSDTYKVLYIDNQSDYKDNEVNYEYFKSQLPEYYEVEHLSLTGKESNLDVLVKLSEYYKNGIDFVYSDIPAISKILVDETVKVNNQIIIEKAELAEKQTSLASESSETSEVVETTSESTESKYQQSRISIYIKGDYNYESAKLSDNTNCLVGTYKNDYVDTLQSIIYDLKDGNKPQETYEIPFE